jgi:glycosyltransferase involved in cell wall biosynthesis
VIDFHSVETAMFRDLGESSTGADLKSKLRRDVIPERVRIIERHAAQQADQIWVCSEDDARLMSELHAPAGPLHVVPNTIEVDHYAGVRADLAARRASGTVKGRTVVYPALFHWEPNAEAAAFLIDETFPRLARIFPDCRLLLAGASPSAAMIAAAERDPRIVVTGVVADMRPFFTAADAMAVPLCQGGGTLWKILEGFGATIPIITTTKGAEGLAVKDQTEVLFVESAVQFAEAIGRVWTEPRVADRLSANGLSLLKRDYSWEVSSARIAEAIAELDAGGRPLSQAQ